MNIIIETKVEQHYRAVMEGFTENLFLALAPPFPPFKLLRFDGCNKGDVVQLELNFLFFKQRWDALIIAAGEHENEIYFVDEGTLLPFFLKTWKHRHRIVQQSGYTSIIDDFEYTCPFFLLEYLIYPILFLQFYYRKPIYKRIFKAK